MNKTAYLPLSSRFLFVVFLSVLLISGGCGKENSPAAPAKKPVAAVTPKPQAPIVADVDGARIIAADPANWLSHGRTYDEQRYSPLKQVNDKTISDLGLAWYVGLETKRGVEVTPLVVDGVMYLSSFWNVILALDARTGRELWRYDPKTRRDWLRSSCCDAINRGLAVWKGKVYEGVLDGRLIAVDAATGKLAWSVQTTDPAYDYSITAW